MTTCSTVQSESRPAPSACSATATAPSGRVQTPVLANISPIFMGSGVVPVDGLGHADRLLLPLHFEGKGQRRLSAPCDVLHVDERGTQTEVGTDRHRARKAEPVEAVVHAHRDPLDTKDLAQERDREREGQVAVSDRATERPRLGPLDVDVDPLVVASRVGELVDLLLRHLVPAAVTKVLTGPGLQLVDAADDRCHAGTINVLE